MPKVGATGLAFTTIDEIVEFAVCPLASVTVRVKSKVPELENIACGFWLVSLGIKVTPPGGFATHAHVYGALPPVASPIREEVSP